MNKLDKLKTKVVKGFLYIFLALPLLVVLFFAIMFICFYIGFTDTGDLVFYKLEDGAITNIYAGNGELVLTTGNKSFVSGGISSTYDYMYDNVGDDYTLCMQRPVLIYESNVKDILKNDTQYIRRVSSDKEYLRPGNVLKEILIINSKDELYLFDDFDIVKLADNVIFASLSPSVSTGTDVHRFIYYIDTLNRLHLLTSDDDVVIRNNVKEVQSPRENTFYCVTIDNLLLEGTVGTDGTVIFTELLGGISSVKARSFLWRDLGENEENDGEWQILDCIVVLSTNGKLYIKGYLGDSSRTLSPIANRIEYFEDYTLISENVNSFEMTSYAVSFITNDEIARYYGFDISKLTGDDFLDIALLTGAKKLSHGTGVLVIETDEAWNVYVSGSGILTPEIQDLQDLEGISGTPHIIPKNN